MLQFPIDKTLNEIITEKFLSIKKRALLLPLFLILAIILLLYSKNALSVTDYVTIQKEYFHYINMKFSQFPALIYNFNHLGDALVILSFFTIFIIYAPKIWESLIMASILSALFSRLLKDIFSIPRPAEALDNSSFVIIGTRLPGFSSLPSGHSITIFTTLTIIMFAFMPKKLHYKILWCFTLVFFGLLVAFIRVGVGAHYPLDVIFGCTIGFLTALIGILITQKSNLFSWIENKKYYPFFILLFFSCSIVLILKIVEENLIIYYLSLLSLVVSLYKITHVYLKK
jgi:membrane-associated phospholipid phosphatase